jgi:hypothetical protein
LGRRRAGPILLEATGSLPIWLGACPRVFAPPAPWGRFPNAYLVIRLAIGTGLIRPRLDRWKEASMTTPVEYRQYADECLKAIWIAKLPETRAQLLSMAKRWTELAERAERQER